jgi:hypothetical protein
MSMAVVVSGVSEVTIGRDDGRVRLPADRSSGRVHATKRRSQRIDSVECCSPLGIE